MNSIIERHYPLFELYQGLRNELMEILTDEELAFRPAGDNAPLGVLCREIGEVEQSYIDSFKSFNQDFSYRNEEPGIESSVAKLSAWYQELDKKLESAVAAIKEEDVHNRVINRDGDFHVAPFVQLEIYKEALLIFYGKVSVYLKAMGKERPEQWQEWIG